MNGLPLSENQRQLQKTSPANAASTAKSSGSRAEVAPLVGLGDVECNLLGVLGDLSAVVVAGKKVLVVADPCAVMLALAGNSVMFPAKYGFALCEVADAADLLASMADFWDVYCGRLNDKLEASDWTLGTPNAPGDISSISLSLSGARLNWASAIDLLSRS